MLYQTFTWLNFKTLQSLNFLNHHITYVRNTTLTYTQLFLHWSSSSSKLASSSLTHGLLSQLSHNSLVALWLYYASQFSVSSTSHKLSTFLQFFFSANKWLLCILNSLSLVSLTFCLYFEMLLFDYVCQGYNQDSRQKIPLLKLAWITTFWLCFYQVPFTWKTI